MSAEEGFRHKAIHAAKKKQKPRASKVEVYWQKKKKAKPVAKAKARRRALTPSKPLKPSKHPMVEFLREVENGTSLDPDVKAAMLAGFQAGCCNERDFNMSREIACLKTNGTTKRVYACDVCGFVGTKETKT